MVESEQRDGVGFGFGIAFGLGFGFGIGFGFGFGFFFFFGSWLRRRGGVSEHTRTTAAESRNH